MQGDSLSNPQYRNTMDCLRQSVAVEGWGGLFRGFGAAMYRAIPVNAGIFLAVEGTRQLLAKVGCGCTVCCVFGVAPVQASAGLALGWVELAHTRAAKAWLVGFCNRRSSRLGLGFPC